MWSRKLRLKLLVLAAAGALLPAYFLSCEKASRTLHRSFLEGIGLRSGAALVDSVRTHLP